MDVRKQLVLLAGWIVLASTSANAQQSSPILVPTLGHTNKISALTYSRDGRLLATGGSDGIIILWDVDSGAELKRYAANSGVLRVELFGGDNRLFAGYEDGKARIWNTNSGAEVRSFPGYVAPLAHDYLYGAPFAISNDGAVVLTADKDGVVHLWDAATGTENSHFQAKLSNVGYASFSPSSPLVLIAGSDGAAIFDQHTSHQIWRIDGDMGAVQFSKSGSIAITAGADGVHFRDTSSGTLIKTVPLASAFEISVSSDGNTLIGGTFSSGASVWDVSSATKLWEAPYIYGGNINSSISVAMSPDDQSFACAFIDRHMGSWDSEVRVFAKSDFKQIGTLRGATARLLSIGFIGHSPYILAADATGVAFLWRAEGKLVRYSGHVAPIITGALSPDGRHIVLGSLDQSVSLWDVEGDERFHFTGHTQYIASTSFSHDSKYAFSTGGAGFKWSLDTGERMAQFGSSDLDGAVLNLVSSKNDQYVLTQAFGKTKVWTNNGKPVAIPALLSRSKEGDPTNPTLTPDGRLLTINCNGISNAKLPETLFGMRLACSSAYRGIVRGLSKDGTWVMSSEGSVGHLQSRTSAISFDEEREVDLMELSDDNALVLTASLQDDIVHLWDRATMMELCRMVLMRSGNWVVFDTSGRFDTNNIEGTQGLNWIRPIAPFRALPLDIYMRDYFTPGLLSRATDGILPKVAAISERNTAAPEITIEDIQQDTSEKTAQLSLRVSWPRTEVQGHSYDLRVFRGGKLVASVPEQGGLLDPYLHNQTITIKDIQLPIASAGPEIEFSAYAFNQDRVKGRTGKRSFPLHPTDKARSGVAYVLTFGVNVFDDPRWNLRFAANDAREMATDIYKNLRDTSQFSDVIRIPLVSDTVRREGEAAASKSNLQSAIAMLSGHESPNAGALATMHLKQTTPDDLVVIHIATHGYTDGSGTFYVIPTDIGRDVGTSLSPQLQAASISSSELTSWLGNIDAGEIILILDTCQAAAIAGREFKPAPMDDRSFGQLVYDKKIHLLMGTQSDSVALEADSLEHGLLSYSLVRDGLRFKKADFNPLDHTITISEWLLYSATHLGELQTAIATGQSLGAGVTVKRASIFGLNDQPRTPIAQKPVVFDFGSGVEPVIWGQPFFDSNSIRDSSDVDQAEFKAAADISDPIASAAALKRFIAKHRPGAATAAAWAFVTANLIEAHAPSTDLISGARLAVSHLSLVGDARTAGAVLNSVADELDRRHEFPEVVTEFRGIISQLRSR